MDQALKQKAYDHWSELNRAFHTRITRVTGMELLQDLTTRTLNYWERIRRYYLHEIVSDRLPIAQAEHHEMLDLLRQHKGRELAVKVSMHNWRAKEAYLKIIQKQKLQKQNNI
jgi:DNA-binding GntR family transcriptional regulator